MLPFPLNDQVPSILKPYVLGFWWDMAKLHVLQLPTQTIPLDDLRWHLDLPWWRHKDTFFSLTPRQVLTSPQQYQEHYERAMNADLHYSIIVRRQEDRFVIMDGIHRLLKAIILGEQELPARHISE